MQISFFGLGYVGTVYSVGFASKNIQVTGYDVDRKKLALLSSGRSYFYEPGLEELLKKGIDGCTFKVTSDPAEAVMNSNITFVTVGTPSNEDGSIDIRQIIDSSKTIGKVLRKKESRHIVVIKSTVVPGTTDTIVKDSIEHASGLKAYKDFGLAMNPEFLREGNAVQDFLYPDRVVIGSYDEQSWKALEKLYSTFDCPKLITTPSNAELIKYANNSFLAMKVSYINMISNLCQKIPNCDVNIVAKGIGFDNRIGQAFLRAGVGWGGSCWSKDLNAIASYADQLGINLPLIDATCKINDRQPEKLIQLAEELMGSLDGKRVAVLGLAFKPNTDDVRSAVSIKIVGRLLQKGAIPIAYDPFAMENFRRAFKSKKVEYAQSAKSCISGADCALIVTEWDEFKEIEPDDYLSLMNSPVLVDGRRIYEPTKYAKLLKFKAVGLGG